MRPCYSCLKQQHSIQPPFSKDSRHGLSLGSGPQMAGWVSEFCKELAQWRPNYAEEHRICNVYTTLQCIEYTQKIIVKRSTPENRTGVLTGASRNCVSHSVTFRCSKVKIGAFRLVATTFTFWALHFCNFAIFQSLRTQVLTALTSNFGLVGLVLYAW